jgi:hypothetical protein
MVAVSAGFALALSAQMLRDVVRRAGPRVGSLAYGVALALAFLGLSPILVLVVAAVTGALAPAVFEPRSDPT